MSTRTDQTATPSLPTGPAGARTAWTVLPSPIGDLRLVAADGSLVAVDFSPWEDSTRVVGERDDDEPVLVAARDQLSAYFSGERTTFDLPLAPAGTPFQQRVWEQLRLVPFGQTASYAEIARRLGMRPVASRAVGAANGRNPIPVVVPCHRVVGADGKLVGYAGGLERKRTLLDLERDGLF